MATLDGRLTRLEAAQAARRRPGRGRACGRPHGGPLTIAFIRGVLGVVDGAGAAARREPLCLCDAVCGEPATRWFARRSHGVSYEANV